MSEYNPTSLSEGTVFHDRYQIVRCLKAGGMGAIYECVHMTTRKRRALKVMLPDVIANPGMRDRFELEARVTAEIESDHIVETFDAGVDEATGVPFLVMELLRGDDLSGVLEKRGHLNAEETVALLFQVALALDRTHAANIVHRDLKPQNIFLTTRDDGSPRVKILDFGIAKVIADGSKAAKQTAAIGTPIYMAPEQATGEGKIGAPADLYALGHIAYTLLVGEEYWADEYHNLPIFAFLTMVIAGANEPPSTRAARRGITLPIAFDAWFTRATASSPADRFDRASTQITELATALGIAAPRTSLSTIPPSLPVVPERDPSERTTVPTARAPGQGVAASLALGAGPDAMAAGSGTTSIQLGTTVPVVPAKRSAKPFVIGALLLFLFSVGAMLYIKLSPQETVPAVSSSPPVLSMEVLPSAAVSSPELPTASVGSTMPTFSATAPMTSVSATSSPPIRVKSGATTKPTVTVPSEDPTRIR